MENRLIDENKTERRNANCCETQSFFTLVVLSVHNNNKRPSIPTTATTTITTTMMKNTLHESKTKYY